MMKYIAGLALVLFVWIIVFSKIYLNITYKKNNAGDSLYLQVFLGKFCRLYSMKRINIVDTFLHKLVRRLSKGSQPEPVDIVRPARPIQPLATALREKIIRVGFIKLKLHDCAVTRMHCQVKLSAGDAAQTAILFGGWQAVQSIAMAFLNNYVIFKERPQIAISPDFNSHEKEVFVDCIVNMEIGNIIHMLKLYVIMHWREKHG